MMKKEEKEIRIGKHFHFDKNFWSCPIRLGVLDLYQIGELCCERGFKVDRHEQSVYEITYVISGNGFSYTDGEKIPLTKGDILINSVGHWHAMEAAETDIFRYAYIGFLFSEEEGEGLGDGAAAGLKKRYDEKPWRLLKNQSDIFLPFMQCIDEFYTQTLYSRRMIRNYCEAIVIMAIRGTDSTQKVPSHTSQRPQSDRPAVYAAIRYVEENIFTIGTIQKMAQDLGYSYTYLSHLFRAQTGTTLQNYIHLKKIERSVQLLRYGGLSITQVAAMLNYESVQTFSKSFRTIMGIAPTQYIRMDSDGGQAAAPLPEGSPEQPGRKE